MRTSRTRIKARLWDALCVLLIVHTYCAIHCGEWSSLVSALAVIVATIPLAVVVIALCSL